MDKKAYAKVLVGVGMNAPLLTIKIAKEEDEEQPDIELVQPIERRFPMDKVGVCMIFFNVGFMLFLLIFIIWFSVTHLKE